jgi:hypothetical protein
MAGLYGSIRPLGGEQFHTGPGWPDPRIGLDISGEAGLRFNLASPADHSAWEQENIPPQGAIVANNPSETVKPGGDGLPVPSHINLYLYVLSARNPAACGGKGTERNPTADQRNHKAVGMGHSGLVQDHASKYFSPVPHDAFISNHDMTTYVCPIPN